MVDKHLLDVIAHNPDAEVDDSTLKIIGERKGRKSITHVKKTPKSTSKTDVAELKKKVKEIHTEQKKQVSTFKKELKKGHKTLEKHLSEVHKKIEEGKNIYIPEPRPNLENQMLIESMNKLTAVVKQLVVLFNQKITKEEGPLFSKLNEIIAQNEKIAQGILAVADIIQEQQTPPAKIKEMNPYSATRTTSEQIRPQMARPQEFNQQIMPNDLGVYATQDNAPFINPVPQNTAPLPPMSSVPRRYVSPKRMLI